MVFFGPPPNAHFESGSCCCGLVVKAWTWLEWYSHCYPSKSIGRQHGNDGKAVKKKILKQKRRGTGFFVQKTLIWFPDPFNHETWTWRWRYPKTTVWAPSQQHPGGYDSILEAFDWPERFLTQLELKYGQVWLQHKLRTWRWAFSTAFSGIGAPESVRNLDWLVLWRFTSHDWLDWGRDIIAGSSTNLLGKSWKTSQVGQRCLWMELWEWQRLLEGSCRYLWRTL